jgi:hypothetical protein
MQKLFFLVMICLAGCSSGGSHTVYLCNGPQSEVYHRTSHCKGLRKCSTEIEAVDIGTAKERGRRECGWCY